MIYCPSCGTANRDGSRFCNECGTKLPTTTSSLCPMCGTANPPHSLFCEKCGARLVASFAEELEEPEAPASSVPLRKGLSLPTKPAASDTSAASVSAETAEPELSAPAAPIDSQLSPEEVPDWLSGPGQVEQSATEPTPAPEDELPEWMQRLRGASPTQSSEAEEVPDWLKSLSVTAELAGSTELPPAFETEAATPTELSTPAEEIPDWMQSIGAESEPALGTGLEVPEVKAQSAPSVPSPEPLPIVSEELPDWLRDLRPAIAPEEDLPDWLDELASEAAEKIALAAEAEEAPEPASDSALEWVSRLADTGPLGEHPALPSTYENPEEEIPSWLGGLSGAATPAAEETPDWLSGLRTATPEFTAPATSEESAPAGPAATGELPDWLQVLQSEEPGGAEPMMAEIGPPAKEPSEEGTPDWLAGLGVAAAGAAAFALSQDKAGPEQLTASPEPEETEIPDWLSSLRGEALEVEKPQPSEEAAPDWLAAVSETPESIEQPAAEEQPDWLSVLRSAAPETEETPSADVEGVPDWLSDLGAPSELAEQPVTPEEVPAWLHSLGESADTSGIALPLEEMPAAGAEEPTDEGVPDWLKGLGMAAGAAALAGSTGQEQESSTPDWLAGLGAPPVEEPEAAPALDWLTQLGSSQPPVEEAAGSGDWLSALRATTPELDQQPVAAEEPGWLREVETGEAVTSEPLAEVPDWLRDYGITTPTSTPAAEPATIESSDEGVPDWLTEAGLAAGAAVVMGGPSASEQPEEEVPDWLRDMGEQPAPAFKAAEVPDWLSETEQPPEATTPAEAPDWLRGPSAQAPPSAEVLFAEPEPEPAAETPDWLRDLAPLAAAGAVTAGMEHAEEVELEAAAQEEAPEEPEKPAEESRDWIKAAAPIAAAGVAAATLSARKPKEEAAPAIPPELPEWLQQLRQEQAEAPAQPTLTQAEIPAWLAALRPTEVKEAEAPAEVEVEKEGPLAGLANVLPAMPLMGQVHGAPVTLRYEISADDQARAGVLKELMARPASAPRKTAAYVVKSAPLQRRALRWFVTALLVIGILTIPYMDWNAWVFKPLLGTDLLPNLQTLEVPSVTQLAAAQIGALSAGTPVLVVFDYDAGQSDEMNRIAETFFKHLLARGARVEAVSLNPQGPGLAQSVWQKASGGQSPELFTNLGFMPGQAAGIQDVINTVNPVIVVDLAASPDTVRWWAEQLTLSGKFIPLVVGLSASAQTLALPYVKSGQVQGLVVGASGALAYAKQAQLPLVTLNQYELEALTVASWLMAIFVGIALIMALVYNFGRRSAK